MILLKASIQRKNVNEVHYRGLRYDWHTDPDIIKQRGMCIGYY